MLSKAKIRKFEEPALQSVKINCENCNHPAKIGRFIIGCSVSRLEIRISGLGMYVSSPEMKQGKDLLEIRTDSAIFVHRFSHLPAGRLGDRIVLPIKELIV